VRHGPVISLDDGPSSLPPWCPFRACGKSLLSRRGELIERRFAHLSIRQGEARNRSSESHRYGALAYADGRVIQVYSIHDPAQLGDLGGRRSLFGTRGTTGVRLLNSSPGELTSKVVSSP
jgi:hypothetical protein